MKYKPFREEIRFVRYFNLNKYYIPRNYYNRITAVLIYCNVQFLFQVAFTRQLSPVSI